MGTKHMLFLNYWPLIIIIMVYIYLLHDAFVKIYHIVSLRKMNMAFVSNHQKGIWWWRWRDENDNMHHNHNTIEKCRIDSLYHCSRPLPLAQLFSFFCHIIINEIACNIWKWSCKWGAMMMIIFVMITLEEQMRWIYYTNMMVMVW